MRSLAVTLALVTLLSTTAASAQSDSQPVQVKHARDSSIIDTLVIEMDERVFAEAFVQERPALISGPPIRYPTELRRRGISGRVIVQAIIDKSGRAEPKSIKILNSPHSGFDVPARAYIRHAQFRPARLNGRPVRVLVNVPIDFNIGRMRAY